MIPLKRGYFPTLPHFQEKRAAQEVGGESAKQTACYSLTITEPEGVSAIR